MTADRLPPGPPGRWLLGNLPEFRRDMLGFFAHCAARIRRSRLCPSWPAQSHARFPSRLRRASPRHRKSQIRQELRLRAPPPHARQWLAQQRRRILAPPAPPHAARLYQIQREQLRRHHRFRHSACSTGGSMAVRPICITKCRDSPSASSAALMDMDLADAANEVAPPLESAMRNFSRRFGKALESARLDSHAAQPPRRAQRPPARCHR